MKMLKLSIYIVYLVSLILILFPYYGKTLIDIILINSDTVFYFIFTEYISENFKTISEFKLPRSFLIFPEYFIFVILRLLTSNVLLINAISSIAVYVYMQILIFIFFSKYLLKGTKREYLAVSILIITNLLLPIHGLEFYYIWFMAPHSHVGTYGNVLLMFILLDYLYNKRLIHKIFFFTLVAFLTFSDRLFMIYFTFPIIATIIVELFTSVFDSKKPIKLSIFPLNPETNLIIKNYILIILLFISSSIGFLGYSSQYISTPDLNSNATGKFAYMWNLYVEFVYAKDYIFIIPNISIWICATSIAIALYILLKHRQNTPRHFYFLIFGLLSSVLVSAIHGGEPEDLRFSIFFSLLMICYGVFEVFRSKNISNHTGKFLVLLIALLFLYRIYQINNDGDGLYNFNSKDISCITKYITGGPEVSIYTDFWISNKLYIMSDKKIITDVINTNNSQIKQHIPYGVLNYPPLDENDDILLIQYARNPYPIEGYQVLQTVSCGQFDIIKLQKN